MVHDAHQPIKLLALRKSVILIVMMVSIVDEDRGGCHDPTRTPLLVALLVGVIIGDCPSLLGDLIPLLLVIISDSIFVELGMCLGLAIAHQQDVTAGGFCHEGWWRLLVVDSTTIGTGSPSFL